MSQIADTSLLNDANLQGYWKLESGFTDSSSNGYDLTAHNTPTFVTGKYGNAASLASASTQYADRARASIANLRISGSQTWVCWVKQTTLTSYQVPMGMGNSDGSSARGLTTSADNSGDVYFTLPGLTTNTQVSSHPTIIDTGNWHHLAGRYDSSTQKLAIFIDGVKAAEVTASGSATDISSGAFAIGVRGGDTAFATNGLVDDAAIFNRALTDAEIAMLFSGSSPSASLSPSASRSPSSSISPSSSASASLSPSSSRSPSISPSSSASASLSPSGSMSPSASVSPSTSVSPSLSPSSSVSASLSSSPSLGYSLYSRGSLSSLPGSDNDLQTIYTDDEEDRVSTSNGVVVGQQGALQYMLHQFKSFVGDNSICTIEFEGRSTLAPAASPVFLQIMNRLTNQWQTVDSETDFIDDANFLLTANIRTLSQYKDPNKLISCRVYQFAI